ncbi:MAG: SpoIIE family protein phosphatase [Chthoniobacter sp.]|nr:SpoIIE family protein phosphatase [Chthoniobacter sp.]
MTGRDTEVGLLADRWEQAQEGMGQVVTVVGEAGLGKSRLVYTIKELALTGAGGDATGPTPMSPIIEWRCSQRFQNTGLHPVTRQLEHLLNFNGEESPNARFDRLARHLEDHGLGRPEMIAIFAKLLFLPPDERYPAPTLTPVREREETFRALREWLRACARRQPVLFVVEDLHWIDASSLEFLGQFIAEGLHDRILTVLTFRPEFRPPWSAPAHQTSLALNRLTRRQVTELMRRDAGGALPDSLVTQVYQRTGGVPLLVEEFTRMVRESAIVEQQREHEMPATLQQLVMARLDRMSSNREIAQYAATLGREFHYELLAAVVSVDEPTLQAELAKLAGAEILYSKGQPPRCAYQFKHALLEEALHGSLEEMQRRQFHRQVAEVMEKHFPQSAETQPELLAHHFTEAGFMEKAVGYWLQAGRRSHDRFANVEAIGHLTKGLELLATQDESAERDARELELLGPLGTAYIAARGYAAPEVGPVFHRARTLSARVGQTPQAFAMMRGHFAYHIVRGDFRLCTDLAARAVEFGERLDDPGILMEALFLQALTMLYRGDFAGAHACCERALAEYDDRARTAFWAVRTGEDSGVTHRCYLALACWHLGSPERALAVNREARELARSLHHPFSLEYALHHTGWLHQHCRLGAQTQAAGDEQMRIASEQGFLFWHACGTLYSAAGLLLRGRPEEGLPLFQKGLDAYRGTGAGLGLPYYLSLLGEAFMQAGRFEDAHHTFEEALALVETNDERFQEAELHRLRGELHLASAHDEAAAEVCFQRALDTARRQGSRAWELRATMSLARLWHQRGRRHEAVTALTTVMNAFVEGFDTPDLMDAAALLKDLGNEQMHDDLAAGLKYIRGCIPPPMEGLVAVHWRYVPSSTLGGDTLGYHWVDTDHLAFYLIDVTGHGIDSALLSVTITNVIRSGSLPGTDMQRPEQVLAALNNAFQGPQHGYKYFTIWYGVFHAPSRTLTYASGGHPSAIAILPGIPEPLRFPATGPVMGAQPGMLYPAVSAILPPGTHLFIFSDGVFEVRRDKRVVWDLTACTAYLTDCSRREENVMDHLLARVRELRGSPQLDDDFSIIEAHFR